MILSSWKNVVQLLVAPTLEPEQRAGRIRTVEKDIILPIKGLVIAILVYYLFFSNWIDAKGSRQYALEIIRNFFIVYASVNVVVCAYIASPWRITLKWLQTLLLILGLLDGLLMAGLTCVTLGSDSIVYWVFPALILHNALAVPVAIPQVLLNVGVGFCYILGTHIDRLIIAKVALEERAEAIASALQTHKPAHFVLTEETRIENAVERLIVLLLWAVCCYGIQMLFEKQKRAEAEATEFAVRQERLHTAGRLAAEIAHQIKNPLSIITNAAYCLEYSVKAGQTAVEEQIQIIREEVEKADGILTELMGYAQLAEGRVEKLDVIEELNQAIHEVFPPGAKYLVTVRKKFAPPLPILQMQRRHLNGIIVNLLQNAREAMNGCGEIDVIACLTPKNSIQITIEDNGPGIAADKLGKIFDAYFTTRKKGTGLGLAIVKHNAEMYGGSVQVHSELGKGTRFILEFPPRILMKVTP